MLFQFQRYFLLSLVLPSSQPFSLVKEYEQPPSQLALELAGNLSRQNQALMSQSLQLLLLYALVLVSQ